MHILKIISLILNKNDLKMDPILYETFPPMIYSIKYIYVKKKINNFLAMHATQKK